MKKTILSLIVVFALCISPVHISATTPNTSTAESSGETIFIENPSMTSPSVNSSDSALLIDMNSGRLLYGKNINKRIYPASTTKIMTGILAIEMGNFDDVVTVSSEAIAPITIYDSQIGLLVGEKLTLEQLVNAMLIPSANDAANAIAVHLAGSIDGFIEIMNQKAKELGMNNTHYESVCGMHNDNHYTTANDLALLSQYAMKNETFRNIVKTATYKIGPTNKYDAERNLSSTNLFLSSAYHKYPLCTGIKTGHTSKAGYCLVSSAQYENMNLLSVVMGCQNEDLESKAYSYIDSKALYDFGFKNYMNKVVAAPGDIVHTSEVYEAKGKKSAELTVDNTINALVPVKNGSQEITAEFNLPEQISAPIAKGTVLGTVTYSYEGTIIATSNLVMVNDVERNELLHIFHKITKVLFSPYFFIPVLIILLLIYNHRRKQKLRRKRIRRQQMLEAERKDRAEFLSSISKER